MTPTEYLEKSSRTAATKVHTKNIRQRDFEGILGECLIALDRLDQVKKALFYNKEPRWGKPGEESALFDDEAVDRDILHSVVGVATESGELLTLLADPKKLTRAKVVDESGDLLWYMAMLFRQMDITFEEAMEKNIAKLAKRYPDKFTEDLAVNRNDIEENSVFY